MHIGPLLTDLDITNIIDGVGDVSITASSVIGSTLRSTLSTLSGKARIQLKKGSVSGVDIAELIRQAKAKFEGKSSMEAANPKTKFSVLKASVTIDKGIAKSNDLNIQTRLFNLKGQGFVDLAKQNIDYTTTATITANKQQDANLANIKDIPLSLKIGGTFTEPTYKLDIRKALEIKVRQAAKKKFKEIKEQQKEKLKKKIDEKLKDKIDDELKNKLKSLFQ